MSADGRDDDRDASLSVSNISQLARVCIDFLETSRLRKVDLAAICDEKIGLSNYARSFHEECGSLTSSVEAAIDRLRDGPSLILVTGHQPNLFAYSGVFRKTALNCALGEKLTEISKLPTISLFGFVDGDLAVDRWVRSSQLPDMEKREGVLELRSKVPERMRLNRIPKPTKEDLDAWRNEIEEWLNNNTRSVGRLSRYLGIDSGAKKKKGDQRLSENLESFWDIVEVSHARAKSYSDFNAFLLSSIVNNVWQYDTLFFRFSECPQILGDEICSLLSRYDDYSRYVKEATSTSEKGVSKNEYETVPFWINCHCGSKVRLVAGRNDKSLIGHGKCLLCEKEYEVDFQESELRKPGLLSQISFRAMSMPIVFLSGLRACCYVGGTGGKEYLRQTRYVSERLDIHLPPIAIWRPRDIYLGVGQLNALLFYRKLSGTHELSKYHQTIAEMKNRISDAEKELELQNSAPRENLDAKQLHKIRRSLSSDIENLRVLRNIENVIKLYPSIIDYAINIGLKSTSEQWKSFLTHDGILSSNLDLRTDYEVPKVEYAFEEGEEDWKEKNRASITLQIW